MAFGPEAFPELAKLATGLGLAMVVVGLLMTLLPLARKRKDMAVTDKDKPDVVGLDVTNSGDGTGMVINSQGGEGAPSVGAHVTATGLPGQSVTGARITQSGPGTGMKIVQSGPGVGLKIEVGGKSHNP